MKATTIRKGHVLRVKEQLYRVLSMEHVTTGRGRAHIQTKLRNLLDGSQTELRFRSDDDVEQVELEIREMQFLYADHAGFHFMDTRSYDQLALTADALGETRLYLLPDTVVLMQRLEGRPLGVELPAVVELKVVATAPGIKDSTASAQRKPATLETGLVIQVPSFVETGETVRVNTMDGVYSGLVR